MRNLLQFRKVLTSIDEENRRNLLLSINKRKMNEVIFHDEHRSLLSSDEEGLKYQKLANRKFYTTVDRSREYVNTWIRENVADKVVLDYACGEGKLTHLAAIEGAKLSIGMDISPKSLQLAKETFSHISPNNLIFILGDAENTKLPDGSIDIILCMGMLHHLDLSFALPEMRRILKPDGKILAVEALGVNPFIKMYRKLTPHLRTDFESKHILTHKQVKFMQNFLSVSQIKYWHLVSFLGVNIRSLLPMLNRADKFLEKIPIIQRLAWIFTIEMKKIENQ